MATEKSLPDCIVSDPHQATSWSEGTSGGRLVEAPFVAWDVSPVDLPAAGVALAGRVEADERCDEACDEEARDPQQLLPA